MKMKPLRLLYHVNSTPPAYLETYLQQRRYPYDTVRLDNGFRVPEDLDSISGMIFMGGAGNVNQPTDWMKQELELIGQAANRNIPMMGICLGAQLIARALGGEVQQGKSLEIGWHAVEQLDQHQQDWFAQLPDSFEVFQWHQHTFTLPAGSEPLATSKCFELQAFAIDNILAMQFHLEMTPELIESLIGRYSSDLEQETACVQGADSIRDQLNERAAKLHRLADTVYDRWMKVVETE